MRKILGLSLLFVLASSAAPVDSRQVRPGEESRIPIEVPLDQQGKIGIRMTEVGRKPIEHTIRTVGSVTADERTEAHVHTRISGWIDQLFADFIGKQVSKGQPLFSVYSPDLVATQQEYLAARRQGRAGKEVAKAALERLKLWGVPGAEIDDLVRNGKAKRSVTFLSPVSGYVINKTAINGMYITPEMELYHIADLSTVWIIVTLYEYDLSIVAPGDNAQVQLPYDPTRVFSGKISYIYPEVQQETRTARARIEIQNKDFFLKPGMFANVEMTKNLGESIVIPDDSVIDTGLRRIVFVKTASTRFEPREIRVGPRVGNEFTVLSGLSPGEQVVTSANFLIDAESKFQAALQKGGKPETGHAGHGSHGQKNH